MTEIVPNSWARLTSWDEPWMHPRHRPSYVEALHEDTLREMRRVQRRAIRRSLEALGRDVR